MRRRTYLTALAAGTTATAGCGQPQAQGDEEEEPTATPTATPTPAGEPDVTLVEAYPGALTFEKGDVVDVNVELRNDGGEGSVPVRLDLGSETVAERTVEVAPGRQIEEFRVEGVAEGYYEYTVTVGEATASGTFTVGTPVERPRVVREHTVLGQEERSVARAERLHVDVGVNGDPDRGIAPPGRSAILDICRKLVLEALEAQPWDVVRFDVWRESQTVGEERPHGTVTWGPHGNWSGVGTGAEGDYSRHAFDVAGAQYLVVQNVQAVRAGRWTFNVKFDVLNQGLEREAISGTVRTNRTEPHRFGVDLEPGDRTTVRYRDSYRGPPRRTTYTIEADGDGRLYGPTSGEIEFS